MKTVGTYKIQFILKPSQFVNIGWFLAAAGTAFITPAIGIFFGVIWLWNCLVIAFHEFQFAERTITEKQGVLNIRIREVHYYRIKSIRMEEPLLYRLVGISRIELITSDPLIPAISIFAIDKGDEVRNYLKEMTVLRRQEQGVKEYDLR